MRHVRSLGILGALAVMASSVFAGGAAAWAAPTPGASGPAIPVPAAQKPTTVCTVGATGSGAVHMTGLAALKDGSFVSIDGQNADWGQLKIIYLEQYLQAHLAAVLRRRRRQQPARSGDG